MASADSCSRTRVIADRRARRHRRARVAGLPEQGRELLLHNRTIYLPPPPRLWRDRPELNTGLRCVVPACPLRQPDMVFLFVGSSALTEASFPRDLAIPQLLLSNVWIILPLITRNPMTVFIHRGLSPHQFTPMSGAHKITGANCGGRRRLPLRTHWTARVAQFCRCGARGLVT